jgi:hypothetical protein
MPDLEDDSADSMPKRMRAKNVRPWRTEPVELDGDALRNPNGVYSSMTKRVAIENGRFAEIQNMPPDGRKSGQINPDHTPPGPIRRK